MRIPLFLLALAILLVPVSSAREASVARTSERTQALITEHTGLEQDPIRLDGDHRVLWGPCHKPIRGPDIPVPSPAHSELVSIVRDLLPC